MTYLDEAQLEITVVEKKREQEHFLLILSALIYVFFGKTPDEQKSPFLF